MRDFFLNKIEQGLPMSIFKRGCRKEGSKLLLNEWLGQALDKIIMM